MVTARTLDLPPLTTQRARTARKRFWAEARTADENEIQQGIAPYVAQSVRRPVNADVRINNNGLMNVQWTFHTVNRKSIDNAVTI